MDNDNQKTSGKGIVQGTSDAVRKIMRIKKIAVTVSTVAPALGVVFLVILAAVIVFLPIISTYSFTGGIFNSSTSNNEQLMMPMNLEGFTEEDVKIFQTLKDGRDEYKKLKFKKNLDEEIDLSLLISTIQNQGLINFNDEGEVFDIDSEIVKNEEQIKNFETLDDFNSYVNKYGYISSNSNQKEDYHGETIIENKQNPEFYNNLKDKGGSVYYIYPGNRMLLGYMVANDVSYYAVEYERWICDDGWCDNSKEIWSDWSILRKITSNNGKNSDCDEFGSAWQAICNINSGVSFAESYNGDPNSWEYKNVKYDLEQLAEDVLGGIISDDAAQVILDMLGDDVTIPDGDFVEGRLYAAVSVKKYVNYDLYENYAEDVFIKHLYLDCENCEYKNASNEVKKNVASTIYNNIYSIKELFDYFNDETIVSSSNTSSSGGMGTHSVSYSCSNGNAPNLVSYYGHLGIDLNGVPIGTQVYPLFEGTVVSINNCNQNYYPEVHYKNGSEYYTCQKANANSCGYGNMIRIQGTAADGIQYYAIYGHLSRIDVSVGDKVDMNTVIGLLGNTGCSTGAHLHLELRTVSGNDVVYADNIYTKSSVQSVLCSR